MVPSLSNKTKETNLKKGHCNEKRYKSKREILALVLFLAEEFRTTMGLLQLSNHVVQKSPNWRAIDALGHV